MACHRPKPGIYGRAHSASDFYSPSMAGARVFRAQLITNFSIFRHERGGTDDFLKKKTKV